MDRAAFVSAFNNTLNRDLAASLQACTHCGLCAESCHYYLAEPDPANMPVMRAEAVRSLLRPRLPWSERSTADWEGLKDQVFGRCTMCNRCLFNCPSGVDTAAIVRRARGILARGGMLPSGLQATVDMHWETGNNMGISREDMVDTVEWMEEQLQDDTGDEGAKIPLDQPGVDYMYLLNPREIKYYPLSLLAAARIFYAAGVSWTLSTAYWDVTNYALFSGEDDKARDIAGRMAAAARQLEVKSVVMAECGHGYRSQRWEAAEWLQSTPDYQTVSLVELMAAWIAEGRLRVHKVLSGKKATYHDPCNQARNGGIVTEPRQILSAIIDDFIELTPHGIENYCCGGGGGMLAMSEYSPRRLEAGAVKARQIKNSGAQVIVTSCHNCLDQLQELKKHYQLGVQVFNLSELVAQALIPGPS